MQGRRGSLVIKAFARHAEDSSSFHHMCNMCEAHFWGYILHVTCYMFSQTIASKQSGTESTVSHGSGRILVAAWWIFTTILSAIYCGTIMATLAVRLQQPPFTNFAELAAREDYKIGFDSSSIISQYFQVNSVKHIVKL